LFFDYCKANEEQSMQDWFNFVSEVGDSFLEAYVPIVEKKGLAYSPEHKTLGKYVVVVM
jgi:coproporphyrinogen III oxidase